MTDCIHRRFCTELCPCDYYEKSEAVKTDCIWQDTCDKYAGKKDGKAKVKIIYGGMAIIYAECGRCKQTFSYPTDKPYTVCPYCKSTLQ